MPGLSGELINSISTARFEPYLLSVHRDVDRALALYLWNAQIGGAFHLPIQSVEIALRNRVARALFQRFGPLWWRHHRFRLMTDDRSLLIISDTLRRLTSMGKAETHANVVGAMSFGFWIKTLRVHAAMMRARPTDGSRLDASETYRSASHIAALRNRIAHHEPIFRRDLLARSSGGLWHRHAPAAVHLPGDA